MKNVLILIMMIWVTSCSIKNPSKEVATNPDTYETAYEKASTSKQSIDTVFMGLRFGMSEKQVSSYLRKMLHDGKIRTNDLGQYEYVFKTRNADISATLGANYFNGELYEFIINLDTYYINGIPLNTMSMDVISDGVKGLFIIKYLKKEKGFKKYNYNNGLGNSICYIKDNLAIDISPLGVIRYTNVPIERKKASSDNKKKSSDITETLSDL